MNIIHPIPMDTIRRGASALFVLSFLVSCGGEEPDAYGNFEAEEVRVSAEIAGQLQRFDVTEGDRIAAGEVVGQIDTTSLALQRDEQVSRASAARARATEAEAGIGVLLAQLETAGRELDRTTRLFDARAATAQQLDRAHGEVRVLRERIAAARAQVAAASREVESTEAAIERVTEQLRDASILNPVAGTVLTTHARAGELVQPGQPLYTIADLHALTLRAYVTGAQLAAIRIGRRVEVRIDGGEDELIALPGEVTWVSAQAEFTPTPIQTREERTTQVYAVKVRVPNPDGLVKIGMPGELYLGIDDGRHDAATEHAPAEPD